MQTELSSVKIEALRQNSNADMLRAFVFDKSVEKARADFFSGKAQKDTEKVMNNLRAKFGSDQAAFADAAAKEKDRVGLEQMKLNRVMDMKYVFYDYMNTVRKQLQPAIDQLLRIS